MNLEFERIVTHLPVTVYLSMLSSKQCLAMFFSKRPFVRQEAGNEYNGAFQIHF